MKPETFSQILLILVVSGILGLTAMDKPLPASLLLLLGVLCPSPLQALPALGVRIGGPDARSEAGDGAPPGGPTQSH